MKYRKAAFSATAVLMVTLAILIVRPTVQPPRYSAAETKEIAGTESPAVQVFFSNGRLDPGASGDRVFAVERRIPRTHGVARSAIEELLKGPTDSETAQDYFTNINTGVRIQRLVIDSGTAVVDFNEQLEFRVAGACRVSAICAQITRTLMQFPTVEQVVISINGRTQDILQP